ncbi:hypothetical protein, partial [Ferrovum myxofaciens]|uniref:hypothetical protein n=1 Tax=Ferrovum myxofaciens TaxID=416213 RepID=UPI001F33615C
LHWSLRYPLQKQPRAGSAATSKIGFHVKCFLHFLKIFIAQMGTFDIWKNPRMSKVQLAEYPLPESSVTMPEWHHMRG